MNNKVTDPVTMAQQWLKQQFEGIHGPMGTWPEHTMNRYHYDLGLLMDFVTSCPYTNSPEHPTNATK